MAEISDRVRELIRRRLPGMDHVEVLMRLVEAHGEPVSVDELCTRSRLGPETTLRCAEHLVGARLASHDAAARAYAYSADATDRAAVAELSVLYHQRPVTLVKLVYQQPPSPVTSFADAFRLRDPEEKK